MRRPLLWLGLGATAILTGVAVALSDSGITDTQVQDAFCQAWAEGIRDPSELRYVAARVLVPDAAWPPTQDSPRREVDLWDQLGRLANKVADDGPVCE